MRLAQALFAKTLNISKIIQLTEVSAASVYLVLFKVFIASC